MNNPKLYTVKEAAKVVGVSTNTLYKYLDDGKIHAARGSALQGRFRIPESALEEFLGVKLAEPEIIAPTMTASHTVEENLSTSPLTTPLTPAKAHFPLKLVRLLLILALIAILVDLFIAKTVSLPLMISRLFFVIIMLLLAYQEGGYRRSNGSL